MGPGSWNRRLGPAALPDCPFANRSPGLFWMFWLFLQLNNSQFSNCQIRNTRIFTASVTPMLGIRAKGQVDPSKADFGTCSTCFIWCTSGSVLSTTLLAVFAIHTQIIAIAPARPIAQRSPSALSRSSMRREHCGNFSVADIVMSARLSNGPGVIPAQRQGRRVARCFHTRGGTVLQATLSSFMHEQPKFRKKGTQSPWTRRHRIIPQIFKVSHYCRLLSSANVG